MMRLSAVRRGGGHGDLFPTSKEAAHLDMKLVLSRVSPRPPGAGRRYVSVKHDVKPSKFQSVSPAVSTRQSAAVAIKAASADSAPPTPHALSSRACHRVLGGIGHSLNMGGSSSGKNAVSEDNIRSKTKSEELMHTRTFPRKFIPITNPAMMGTLDLATEIDLLMVRTTSLMTKIADFNRNGYEKEWFDFEEKPKPPAPEAAKK